jgi:hypothetical protein
MAAYRRGPAWRENKDQRLLASAEACMAQYNIQLRAWHAVAALVALAGNTGPQMYLRVRSVDDAMRDAVRAELLQEYSGRGPKGGSCKSYRRCRFAAGWTRRSLFSRDAEIRGQRLASDRRKRRLSLFRGITPRTAAVSSSWARSRCKGTRRRWQWPRYGRFCGWRDSARSAPWLCPRPIR